MNYLVNGHSQNENDVMKQGFQKQLPLVCWERTSNQFLNIMYNLLHVHTLLVKIPQLI